MDSQLRAVAVAHPSTLKAPSRLWWVAISLARSASPNNHFFDRYRLLAYPTAALMQNLPASTVTLSVDGTSQSYQGVVLELVGTTAGSNPIPSDSIAIRCGRIATPMRSCSRRSRFPTRWRTPRISAAPLQSSLRFGDRALGVSPKHAE